MVKVVRPFGELPIEIPRDREGRFEPQIISEHQTRWVGFDDKILSLYARGMTVREIQQHLTEMYMAPKYRLRLFLRSLAISASRCGVSCHLA